MVQAQQQRSWVQELHGKSVKLSNDGTMTMMCCAAAVLQVWDMDIGDCVLRLAPGGQPVPLTALAVSPDGALCLTANEKGQLVAWDLQSGTALQTTQAHNGRCVWGNISVEACGLLLSSLRALRVLHGRCHACAW